MSTRDDRRAAAREGILAAAHRQVAEGGCASASVAAVAGRAGVAAGSLYRHFPSRADLLAEVVGSALRAEHLQLADAAREAGTPRAALSAWVRVA
ncbi:MAG: transcriptional regulator, TetR family, partial [Solirubrobacterales bacterium]|nr:transcriptional regulator, TetR family [Solirubrobacterales bacterium]